MAATPPPVPTIPSSHDDGSWSTFTYCGAAPAAPCAEAAAALSATAWLNLLPAATEDQFPRTALAALGLPMAHEPLPAPHGLTLDAASRILAALASLPQRGALVVQCATGNRASAVLALLVGARRGWAPNEALAWAQAARLPFLSTQPLRNWVALALRSRLAPPPRSSPPRPAPMASSCASSSTVTPLPTPICLATPPRARRCSLTPCCKRRSATPR